MTSAARTEPTAPAAAPPCPLTVALDVFGDRWTLSVLRDVLIEGLTRYNELLAANPGLATNILADRLRRLVRYGFLDKRRDPQDARRFLYRPTERAVGVVPMILEMIVWGANHGASGAPSAFVDRFERERDGVVAQLQRRIRENAGLADAPRP